ncbi:acyltransferase family protein [Agromyces aureus]|uniref:Acyltransferase 3 domain-containing protein n=1 Tax=Agromyces aureus TaxID=453304 RepID=A0A191WHC9_9MICO|nr:acyltransferase [Agromyces aureus]ANJ27666.1 hypothetical protein ATC03_14065 [Agromyces aureus]
MTTTQNSTPATSGQPAREALESTSGRPDPIPALTGLRIVGAAWVVLFHFQPILYEAWPSARILEPVLGVGSYGVPLFFILSGYIIWHNYGSPRLLAGPRPSIRFLWRRYARLWPVNVLSLILVSPAIWWGVTVNGNWGAPVPDWYSIGGWLKSAFMVSGLDGAHVTYGWNNPAWSLTAEMAAYVAFPLLLAILLAARIPQSSLRALCLVPAIALAVFIDVSVIEFPYRWLVDLLLTFTAGVLLRIAGRPHRLIPLANIVQVLAPVLVVVACYTGYIDYITVLLLIWVWALAAPRGPVVRLFTTRAFQVAGYSSYSLYMLHFPLFAYGFMLLYFYPSVRSDWLPAYVVAALTGVYVASWVTWKWFETPAREAMNRLFERCWPKMRSGQSDLVRTSPTTAEPTDSSRPAAASKPGESTL